MKYLFPALLGLLLALTFSCRHDEVIHSGSLDLRFSTDTLMLDTVFETIGSSTYLLKVYNDKSETVRINQVRLEDAGSPFRININGKAARSENDVEILPKDSIYIFVEVTASEINTQEALVTDKIVFSSGDRSQHVDLVSLALNAHFHPPTDFLVLGSGRNATVIPYSVIDCNDSWDDGLPHVVYGYAVVDEGCQLTIAPGTDVHFHRNSGLWVFDEGVLSIAENAQPGLGDSVTFSSDRLEPGFAEDPGQWGGALGGLYLAQGARATINNLVIKNATTGLRCDSALYNDQLEISNSYILNSSRTALFGGYGNIDARNLVVANSGLYSLYAFGGNYEFRHCTFANYWSGSTRQEPAVLLTNFLEFTDDQGRNQRLVRDIERAYFGNCIIYGNNNNELSISKDGGGQLNFEFNHALIKLDSDPQERNVDLSDPGFTNVDVNLAPSFRDAPGRNYDLDSASQAVDQGNVTDGALLQSDILGRNRNFNGLPDLGAYERQF